MLQTYVFIVDQQRFIHNFFGCIVEIPLRGYGRRELSAGTGSALLPMLTDRAGHQILSVDGCLPLSSFGCLMPKPMSSSSPSSAPPSIPLMAVAAGSTTFSCIIF